MRDGGESQQRTVSQAEINRKGCHKMALTEIWLSLAAVWRTDTVSIPPNMTHLCRSPFLSWHVFFFCVCFFCLLLRVLCGFPVSHPAAPCSGTFRQSRFGCGRLLPRSFTWLMLLGRKGRAALLDEGCLWVWCCVFLWLAAWLVFFRPPFWWATAEKKKKKKMKRCTGEWFCCVEMVQDKLWDSDVAAAPGGPGAARDGMLWWVLDMERPWVMFFLVGPEDEIPVTTTCDFCQVCKPYHGWLNKQVWILTCVLGKPGADADLQGFARGLQHRHVSLSLDKQHLPGAASAQEAPVLLLQLHLQSENDMNLSFIPQ